LFACWPASRLGFAIYLAKIILKKKGGKEGKNYSKGY